MAKVERFSMIIWAPAREETPEAEAERVYRVLSLLDTHEAFRPFYWTRKGLKQAKAFTVTRENVAGQILQCRDNQFPSLGSHLGFFRSLEEDGMGGVSIVTGVTNPRFINNIIVDVPRNYPITEPEAYGLLADIFQKLVDIYEPFYATVASHVNLNMFGEGGYTDDEKKSPRVVFWLNFWGAGISRRLRLAERADVAALLYEMRPLRDGYLLRLHERPFYATDEDAVALQRRVGAMLGI